MTSGCQETDQWLPRENINPLYRPLSPLNLIRRGLEGHRPNSAKKRGTHPQSTPSWQGCGGVMEPGGAAPRRGPLWGSWWPGRRCCASPAECHTPWCSARHCPPTKSIMGRWCKVVRRKDSTAGMLLLGCSHVTKPLRSMFVPVWGWCGWDSWPQAGPCP